MSHQVGYDDLIKVVLENNPQANSVMIEEAYEFAREMHEGQYRKSGEPYIIHPVNVAIILADLGLDDNAIAAGLLHDVVEDTDCSSLDLERKFNEEVAFLVEGVTKLDKIQCHSKEERQLESYRKMFIAMAPGCPRHHHQARRPTAQHAHHEFPVAREAKTHRSGNTGDLFAAGRPPRYHQAQMGARRPLAQISRARDLLRPR